MTVELDAPPSVSWSIRKSVVLVASLVGLGISIYLTLVHYDHSLTLSCPSTAVFNCATVQHSPQAVIFGVPVAVLGLPFFVVMVALALPYAWRIPSIRVAQLRLAASVVGLGFAFYLVYTELFTIHAICLWCSGVHVLTFIIFMALATGWEEATDAAYLAEH
ncbi:MAG TPA: vitamin K epoxide reductase family protein [Acidimicrobiales bacterium]|nr:vitamin K epoxide reductase family protein [Acidimicrobiales bacterium]